MRDLGSDDHKRAPERIDVQSHAAMKKCSTSPLKRPQLWCCSKEDKARRRKWLQLIEISVETRLLPGWYYKPRI